MGALFAACRLVRCEAALLLALSASSPFLDGVATGAHSQRWLQFPLTPPQVPLFRSHSHYIAWVEEQLASGAMQNVRHLWTSVRPNGDNRPHGLNRLELRICDLITDPALLLAITAYCELRIQQLLADPASHDPLIASQLTADELASLADANDRAAARSSLQATLSDWRTGAPIQAADWIRRDLASLAPLAEQLNLAGTLAPLDAVLGGGNQAMRWLQREGEGLPIATIVAASAAAMAERESALNAQLATDALSPLG